MVFRIEPYTGRCWQVFRNGVPVFSAGYRQVEDWLDWAENSGGYSTSPETPPSRQATPPPFKKDGSGSGDFSSAASSRTS